VRNDSAPAKPETQSTPTPPITTTLPTAKQPTSVEIPKRSHLEELRERGATTIPPTGAKLESLTLVGLKSPLTDDDLQVLATQPGLRSLELSGGKVTDAGLLHLKPSGQLEEFTMKRTSITDKTLARLGDWPHLKSLSLLECRQLTDAGMAHLVHLQKLEKLNLAGIKITDASITYLKELKALKELELGSQTKISQRGLQELAKAFDDQLTLITD
jgi:hypothetical protein